MFINIISAGIFFSELNSKYNLGDMIELTISIDPIVENRLIKISLVCNGNVVIEFNNLPDAEGKVNIKLPLNIHTINQANGGCYFLGNYIGDTRKSNDFEISKKLIIKLSTDSFFSNPGDQIIISGTAERLNGNKVDGEVEINVPLLSLLKIEKEKSQENITEKINKTNDENAMNKTTTKTSELTNGSQTPDYQAGKFYGKVSNGDFLVDLKIPEDAPAGNFRIDILVYEKSDGYKHSEGVAIANLKVFQVLKSINLALNNQNFDPGEIIQIKPSLLDQTGVNIDGELSVIIRNENKRVYEKIVKSEKTFDYQIPTNFSSGYYEIESSNSGITSLKSFYVNQKAIASFELINETLTVTNIGNIPYKKSVEVELNGKSFVENLNLNLGESRKFKLTGPENEYNIKISDGVSEITQSGVKLTGYAVNVNTISGNKFLFSPIIWIFLIVILLIVILFLFRNVFKKRSLALHGGKDVVIAVKKEDTKRELENERATIVYNKADHEMVMKGHKSNAAIISLKIKNEIGNFERQLLEKAIESVYDMRGAVYEQNNFIFVIFSPLMTKTMRNEIEAVKAGLKILGILNEHNSKFKDKIDFGIGINSGDILNKIEDKKLKFTALGNFMIVAKRLSDISNKQVLVTKIAYERGIADIKAEKSKINDNIYEVKSVIDHEKNREFIGKFLDRQRKGNSFSGNVRDSRIG